MKTSLATLLAATALPFAAVAGEIEPPGRLDVTSVPEKAKISVDGKMRGIAPQGFYDLTEGRHWIRATLEGYRPQDLFVRMESGIARRADFNLEREEGLLLIDSVPSGAEVRDIALNRTTLGKTPLLLTNLHTARDYVLELSLTGYGVKRVKVAIPDRRPVFVREELVNDSGTLVCSSKPAGAEVVVNGTSRGKTPLEIQIPKGQANVVFRLAGYREQSRDVRLAAGERQDLSLEMQGIPATLAVVTSPGRANVFLDNSYQGRAPLTIEDIAPGVHSVRAEQDGYTAETKAIQLKFGE